MIFRKNKAKGSRSAFQMSIKQTEEWGEIKPIFSLVLIFASLLFVVFIQMEERRMGYHLLKLSRIQKELVEEIRVKNMGIAKLLKPQHIEKLAHSKLTMKKIENHQVIHMNDQFQERKFN